MQLYRTIAFSAAVLMLSASCQGPTEGPGGPGVVNDGLDPAVLDQWRDFPVDADLRPILLIGQPLLETGYHTGDAKIAVATGRIDLTVSLPDGPPTVSVQLDGVRHDLPAISAESAFEQAKAVGKPENAPDARPAPLAITKVELGSASFRTDRGDLELPAWLFHAAESFEPLAWPALSPEAFYRFGELDYSGVAQGGELSADGRTLTVVLPAPHPGACPGEPYFEHLPEMIETETAVLVGVNQRIVSYAPGPRKENCGRDAMLRTAPYTFKLDQPLGNRVVIDSSGSPVPITVAR